MKGYAMLFKTKWIIAMLICSCCINILAVILLNESDKTRKRYAGATFYLGNYQFWHDAKNNRVLLYSMPNKQTNESIVDGWTIIRCSLNVGCKNQEFKKEIEKSLESFLRYNYNAAVILAGHLLLNGDKRAGKKIIDELAQVAPDYYYSRVKESPVKIDVLQQVAEQASKGDMYDKALLEDLDLQYKMRIHDSVWAVEPNGSQQ